MLPAPRKSHPFDNLVAIMAALRSKHGCPWDKKQTHKTLKPYLIEETYELVEALDSGDPRRIQGELGDFVWQALFHAQLAAERGEFDIYDVLRGAFDKMLSRHPHVFGTQKTSLSRHDQAWETLKAKEAGHRGRKSALEGVPRGMPALLRARRVLGKAAKVKFEWNSKQGAWDKMREEWREFEEAAATRDRRHAEEELGDLLMAAVNVARYEGLDPEHALHAATDKVMRRFAHVEKRLEASGKKIGKASRREVLEHWRDAKREEKKSR